MAKNRKTKKEKQRSAKRHTLASLPTTPEAAQPTNESVYRFNADTLSPRQMTPVSEQSLHLREDLLRTAVVTGAIILAEMILFFTLSSR